MTPPLTASDPGWASPSRLEALAENLGGLKLRVARTFLQRLRGLIGFPPLERGQGLLLLECAGVHTCFVPRGLDVVYLDRRFIVRTLCPHLAGWRFSLGGRRVAHALELAPGEIVRLRLQPGQALGGELDAERSPGRFRRLTEAERQRGSAMVEFAVVAPIILVVGLMTLQYALMFFAKNEVTHASFMAARAGTVAHADIDAVRQAYARALVPLYAAGRDEASLAQALAKATADVSVNTRIEILNPTVESFDDWGSPELEAKYGRRAIRNDSLASRDPAEVHGNSGQNMQDANLLKIRLTHGYEMKVPLAGTMVQYMLKWADAGEDAFVSDLYARRRIPIVMHATMLMQTDALEPESPVSAPGRGNDGKPVNPGSQPVAADPPPKCVTASCASEAGPSSGGSSSGSIECSGGKTSQDVLLSGDLLFDFGQSTLTSLGKSRLDQLIAAAKGRTFESLQLVGHTDPLGTATLNDALSLSRAQAVKSYLQANGFPDKPIRVEGRGARELVKSLDQCPAGDQQISCLSEDRRVVATFVGLQ